MQSVKKCAYWGMICVVLPVAFFEYVRRAGYYYWLWGQGFDYSYQFECLYQLYALKSFVIACGWLFLVVLGRICISKKMV